MMVSKKRIFLNIIATYGRTLVALMLGLFSARWVLLALGHTDFGLYGVVGSIIVFITFFNGVLGSSVARFYAYAIGQGSVREEMQSCGLLKSWFNTALVVHTVIPLLLIMIGYPIGRYAIEHWLSIPAERVWACVWVFRISLITAFVSMISIPFIAFYTAHQDIVELSLWGLGSTILIFLSAYMLRFVQIDKLVSYAAQLMLIYSGIPICQMIRARFKYRACKISILNNFRLDFAKKLFSFASWQLFGNCGSLMRGQACAVLTNIYFGPTVNAAYGVSNQVLGQTGSLASALIGAFTPAVTTAEGSGDRELMTRLAWRASKYGTLLLLLFAIPLSLEIKEVLHLWLHDPPEWSASLCLVAFADVVINKMTVGQQLAISAQGKIAQYQATLGLIMMSAFPIAWVFILLGVGPKAVVFSLILTTTMCSVGRAYFGSRQVGMGILEWVCKVVVPITLIIVLSVGVGSVVVLSCRPSFQRVAITTLVTLLTTMVTGWLVLLDSNERNAVKMSISSRINNLARPR